MGRSKNYDRVGEVKKISVILCKSRESNNNLKKALKLIFLPKIRYVCPQNSRFALYFPRNFEGYAI
jgi:hypothetical protein